jgi:hypothetical protein
MANEWKSAQSLPYSANGYASITKNLEKCYVEVYTDPETTNNRESFSGYSFKSDTV